MVLSANDVLKLGIWPLAGLGGGGIAAYVFQDSIQSNKWLFVVLGALAGLGLGLFVAVRA